MDDHSAHNATFHAYIIVFVFIVNYSANDIFKFEGVFESRI
jgi:hypothetical protein